MNIILLEAGEVQENQVKLTDHRAAHIIKILKSQPGDSLRVGIIGGPQGTATVKNIDQRSVRLFVTLGGRPQRPQTDLLLALPRPIMLKRIFTQAAALGVGRIFLSNAARVEKSFFKASLLEESNTRGFLLKGLEQAVDTKVPKVRVFPRFKPFVEDYLTPKMAQYQSGFIAHPTAEANLWRQSQTPLNGRVLLAIGPEGGWQEYEIEKLMAAGLKPFSMGPRILKVDTAVIATLAQIDLLRQGGAPN